MKKTISAIAAAGVMAFAANTQAADSLTIVSWGGAYTASQTKAYHDPYTKMTGTNIVNDDPALEFIGSEGGA